VVYAQYMSQIPVASASESVGVSMRSPSIGEGNPRAIPSV
jgi:hypothetical protein